MATKKELAEQKRAAKKAEQAAAFEKTKAGMTPENKKRFDKFIVARDQARKNAPSIEITEESKQRMAAWEAKEKLQDEEVKKWINKIAQAKEVLSKSRAAHNVERINAINAAYIIYTEVESSGIGEMLYNQLATDLIQLGVKVQKNTTDVALVVRTIFGPSLTPIQVLRYASTLRYARECQVQPSDFIDWHKKTSITKAVESQQKKVIADDDRKELLRRARTLVLRYFEVKETSPFAAIPMLAWQAEKYLSEGNNLCLMLGTAVRKMDRESDYADLFVSLILPPSIELDKLIVDRYAKKIMNQIDYFEEKITVLEEKIWADELHERLIQAEYDEVERANLYWAKKKLAAAGSLGIKVKTPPRPTSIKLKK
jgi:hypothetical protein